MRKQSGHWGFRVLACAVLLAVAVPAAAEWFKDYEAAMDLVKKQQCSAAIPKLQSAIAQKNEEGNNIKFYGMKFGDYFPHFQLGICYFNERNYQAALQELDLSESMGAILRKGDLYARLNNIRSLVRARIALTNQQETPVVSPPPPPVTPKAPPVEEKKIVELPRVMPETKPTAPEPVQTEESPAAAAQKPEQQPEPAVDVRAETAKRSVQLGARKYFEGDYDAAIAYINDGLEQNPEDVVAQFLLGCSYASKYLLSGSQDAQLINSAQTAFHYVKKMRPGYQPREASYFSPAVLAIYSTSR